MAPKLKRAIFKDYGIAKNKTMQINIIYINMTKEANQIG